MKITTGFDLKTVYIVIAEGVSCQPCLTKRIYITCMDETSRKPLIFSKCLCCNYFENVVNDNYYYYINIING